MAFKDGLGRIFNVVAAASGVHIPLTNAQAVTFISFLDAGTQALTLKQSTDGANEVALPVLDRVYKGPGVGGTWTLVPLNNATAYDNSTDATNDAVVFTIGAEQLGSAYNCVECTAATGTCIAIVHELSTQRAPELLIKQVV